MVTEAERAEATRLLRAAITAGQYAFVDGDGEFPKKVWYGEAGRGWFGYCINRIAGTYKGWPIDEDELRALCD